MTSSVSAPAEITFSLTHWPLFPNLPVVSHTEKGISEERVGSLFNTFGLEVGRILSLAKSNLVFRGEPRCFNPQSVSATVHAVGVLFNQRNLLKVKEETLREVSQGPSDFLFLDHEKESIAKTQADIVRAEQEVMAVQQEYGIRVTLE